MRIRAFVQAWAILSMLLWASGVRADDSIDLLHADQKVLGWEFDNGSEFKGATGKLSVEATDKHDGHDTLLLEGDFTGGGNYVQAAGSLPKEDIREVSFWIKDPGVDHVTTRIIDSSGQCHQVRLKMKASDDWQKVVFPLQRFFATRGTSETPTVVAKYESWGGDKDGAWHGPGKTLVILTGPTEFKTRRVLISDVKAAPALASAESAAASDSRAAVSIRQSMKLDEVADGQIEWTFNDGQEFPGAKGALAVVNDEPEKGAHSLKLSADFTKGGAYVGMDRDLAELEGGDLAGIQFKYKTDDVQAIVVRLVDSTKQCHQARRPVVADGQWHEMTLGPKEVCGGEHWGGANDGKWHGPALLFAFNINNRKESDKGKTPSILLTQVTAQTMKGGVVQAASFKCDFEGSKDLPAGWVAEGGVSIDAAMAFKGEHSLKLDRPAADRDRPCAVVSPSFAIVPGAWNLTLGVRANLVSQDASYDGVVSLELLDAGGKVADKITLADVYGVKNWQPISKDIDIPVGIAQARFRTELNKTIGQFWIDELTASNIAPLAVKDHRIDRITFSTAQMGNILFPEDPRTVDVTVEATKALKDDQSELTYVVRDYWGAEVAAPGRAKLGEGKRNDKKRWVYTTTIDLASAGLETGRYYELHALLPQENNEPFHNFTSIAILPTAATKAYKPEEIPFTARNWDNRIPEYLILSDRLGVRIGGIWGSWSGDKPYKPIAPTIDVAQKLGMGVLTGTPINAIEYHHKGYEKYDETAMREGVKNWIAEYGKVRPLIVDLGNEPHGTGDQVKQNIAAYKVVYEAIKSVDPTITVVGSSMGPEEEYFQNGFQNYLDVYDFHIYEDSAGVRKALQRYEELFAKYGGKKPVWSTELGLNCQGLPRQVVAREVIRKLTTFFAAGGQNASWFGLLYPDPEGKALGTNGEAFNLFDSRYRRYAPKIDCVAYYNMINGICIKKFIAEKSYDSGVQAFLFRDRDNHCMQVLWMDQGSKDVFVPLPGVGRTSIVDIDGRRTDLDASGTGVTVSAGEDPVLMFYDAKDTALASALTSPAASGEWPSGVVKGGSTAASILLNGVAEDRIEVVGPAFWNIKRGQVVKDASGQLHLSLNMSSPEETKAREGDIIVRIKGATGYQGELHARLPVTSRISISSMPVPAAGQNPPAVKLLMHNNSPDAQSVAWKVELTGQMTQAEGKYGQSEPTGAYFASASSGTVTIDANQTAEKIVPISGVDAQTVYLIKSTAVDASGRSSTIERPVAGFAGVPRASGPIKLDGTMDDADWSRSPLLRLDEARQFRAIDGKSKWKGVDDLSATAQYLWDDKYLYIGVKVRDDVFCNKFADGMIWNGDGVQILIDPARDSVQKPGKYDYVFGVGTKGPQAVCNMSADARAPMGIASDIVVAARRLTPDRGDMTYVIAIPWIRLAPFKPGVGANLGMTLVINEDDGPGRGSFIEWFGDVQSKELTPVGDLILQP